MGIFSILSQLLLLSGRPGQEYSGEYGFCHNRDWCHTILLYFSDTVKPVLSGHPRGML